MSSQEGRSEPVGRRPRVTRTGRLEAFSDGVFAIAITLLVLDLAIPVTPYASRHLVDAFGHQWPGYLGYLVSFSTVGAIWLGHSAITEYLDRADATLLRLNLVLLLLVGFLPYPTRLLAAYVNEGHAEGVASTIYGLNLFAAVVMLSVLWRYAVRARLVRADVEDEEITLLTQRLTPGLAGYAVLIVTGLFLPVLAVVGYLLLALYFVIPLPIRKRWRHR
jgi:uncharacterized membrane protein